VQRFLDLWGAHSLRAHHQRDLFKKQVLALKVHEVLLVADFKENIQLPFGKIAPGKDFFSRSPVTMLAFVAFRRNGSRLLRDVFCVLSTSLSHTASFVIHCLEVIFRTEELRGAQFVRWWSDGGSHFCNKQLLAAFYEPMKSFGIEFNSQLNYFEAAHGKNICDSVFGLYSRLLHHHAPSRGINSFRQLLQILRKVTTFACSAKGGAGMQHHILEYASLS
jgi:hypothetical protein